MPHSFPKVSSLRRRLHKAKKKARGAHARGYWLGVAVALLATFALFDVRAKG